MYEKGIFRNYICKVMRMKEKVVIILGSGNDEEFAKPIWVILDKYKIPYERRVISAHKRPEDLLKILKEYEKSENKIVYITVAGKSNALSGIVDGSTTRAVIACPPYSEKFSGADVYSSLRMPTGIAVLTILEPESAAIAAMKILSYGNPDLEKKVYEYQQKMREKNKEEDEKIRGLKASE
jgi:5-(carboxyamino)imidazole ribonucleotide mutase